MNRSMQQLQDSLQMLALPVTAQLRMVQEGGYPVQDLAQSYDRLQRVVRQELQDRLTPEQVAVLRKLNRKLEALSSSCLAPDWADVPLRRSVDWQQIRQAAREALVALDWPLDVPPRFQA